MQVKKFEASTMKEALEMVKIQLGPDAIILNAKDNSKSFGLLGRQSIEVTAAISDSQMQKKQWAESRLKEEDLTKLRARSARSQKDFIQKSVDRYMRSEGVTQQPQAQPPVPKQEVRPRGATMTRYIDIEDEGAERSEIRSATGKRVDDVLREINNSKNFISRTATTTTSEERVKEAVKQALNVFEHTQMNNNTAVASAAAHANKKHSISNVTSLSEMQSLKNEIDQLKNILSKMQIKESFVATEQTVAGRNNVPSELSQVYQKLIQNGLDEEIVSGYLESARLELQPSFFKKPLLIEGYIAKKLLSEIQISDTTSSAPVHLFLGPAGSGKSSQLVKMASDYVLNKNKKIGILTLDTEKVGAVDQLRIYSQILNVPFGIIKKPSDWASVQEALKTLDAVFIDFPSNSLREMSDIEKIRKMLPPESIPCEKHFVLSATFKDADAAEMAERYKITKPTDIIFSKLDEAITHGLIYNISKRMNLPLHSFGIGQALPEDFEYATKERVVDLIFRITKLKTAQERRYS